MAPKTPPAKPAAAKHHEGHRARARAKFLNGGRDAMEDYEILELLLFAAIPRKDTKPVAKKLIAEFGGFAEVLAAPQQRLLGFAEGDVALGESAVATLKVAHEAGIRLSRSAIIGKPIIGSWQALVDYCKAAMARAATEQFRLLFLDKKNRLMADEVMTEGTVDHTPVYPREIIKRALELQASALILVHNHPSGDPTPSREDIAMTREIVTIAKPLGISVHDHLVIGRAGYTSFKSQGLL